MVKDDGQRLSSFPKAIENYGTIQQQYAEMQDPWEDYSFAPGKEL